MRHVFLKSIKHILNTNLKKDIKQVKAENVLPKQRDPNDDPAEMSPGKYMTNLFRDYDGDWGLQSVRYHLLTPYPRH